MYDRVGLYRGKKSICRVNNSKKHLTKRFMGNCQRHRALCRWEDSMDKNEAKELLSFHSTRNEDIDNMKWEKGFLGSLRPFRRELYEENFFEVMECLRALKDEFSGIAIEKDIISDIVAIIHYPRVWLAPEGMLGSNHLLTEEQNKHLLAWTDIIESCFMFLLEDDVEDAFIDYEDYLNGTYF